TGLLQLLLDAQHPPVAVGVVLLRPTLHAVHAGDKGAEADDARALRAGRPAAPDPGGVVGVQRQRDGAAQRAEVELQGVIGHERVTKWGTCRQTGQDVEGVQSGNCSMAPRFVRSPAGLYHWYSRGMPPPGHLRRSRSRICAMCWRTASGSAGFAAGLGSSTGGGGLGGSRCAWPAQARNSPRAAFWMM